MVCAIVSAVCLWVVHGVSRGYNEFRSSSLGEVVPGRYLFMLKIYLVLANIRFMNLGALDVKAVSQELGLSVPTVYKLVGEGRLPHRRLGNRILFTNDDLALFLSENAVPMRRHWRAPQSLAVDPVGRGPLGYAVVDGRVHVVPSENQIVTTAFDLYRKVRNVRAVAGFLNSRGMNPFPDTRWSEELLVRVLSNSIYCGKLPRAKRRELEDKVDFRRETFQPIVSRHLFAEVQQFLDEEKRSIQP